MSSLEYRVKEYYYVGGAYGKCNEREIMKEIKENGPLVLSFEPDYQFMFYKDGIYKSPDENWLTRGASKPEWEKVDHSVVVVGWGVDEASDSQGNKNKKKYWLLQNSWGPNWGISGYFKMERGTDHKGIESICEAGTIELIRK